MTPEEPQPGQRPPGHAPLGERVLAGRYALREEVGRGGTGTVWLASDLVLHRDVAVKEVTYLSSLTDEERAALRERTFREARLAAGFDHPAATTVHDVVEAEGRPWIVMQYVPSRTLARVVREDGPLTPGATARVGLQVLAALRAAHRAGIVHRDVKPANVLLGDDGRAWLTDFGISTSTGETTISGEGMIVGSPSYMSPERARDAESGPAGDLWSLGATLYTAVEGRPPFERGAPLATLVAVMSDDPAPFVAAGPLEPLLRGLLVKEPAARLPAGEVAAGLEEVAAGRGPAMGPAHAARAAEPSGSSVPLRPRPDPASVERGGALARFDLDQLSVELAALAAATGAATREAARLATVRVERVRAAAGRALAASPPAPPRSAGGPAAGTARRARDPVRRRRRWRRRLVAVPVVLLLLVLLVLAALVLLGVWAAGQLG